MVSCIPALVWRNWYTRTTQNRVSQELWVRLPPPALVMGTDILCIVGPTASGKSSRAVDEALARNGEVVSVDSRQVYRGLDIGTEKITPEEMREIPHHLLNIRDVQETYSAGDFVTDATQLISEISGRGKLPILVGGTHFYFDALLQGLPMGIDANPELRIELEKLSNEELYARIKNSDERRANQLDPKNRRRLIRALEIIEMRGNVPERTARHMESYTTEWIVLNPPSEILRERIDVRLESAFARGLIAEVQNVEQIVGDIRLNELGLEYKIVGEFLRGERTEESLLPILSAKLWQYARRQKAWLRKLTDEIIVEASLPQDKKKTLSSVMRNSR
jgi:tRNA dimethylallyltransferase